MDFDLAIRGGQIVDGTGEVRYAADLGIVGDTIVQIGPRLGRAGRDIDAAGCIVAPGFIDAHTHDDRALLLDPTMSAKVSQGVTTVVTGNCGTSMAPFTGVRRTTPPLDLLGQHADFAFATFAQWVYAVERSRPSVNVVPLVGHTTLRVETMDELNAPASKAEIAQMRDLLQASLREGARGLSTGLYYPAARTAPASEVEVLVSEVVRAGGVYATHLRDEGAKITEALTEAFDAARNCSARLVVSHHKCAGASAWGRSPETLAMFDRSAPAMDFGFDVYPYDAASTTILLERIPESRRIVITRSESAPEMVGRDLGDIATEWNVSQHEAAERLKPGGAVYFMMDEDDVRRILAHPMAMIGSDGMPHDAHPHPRLWGTFPRVLGHYARDMKIFPLETAVHKMTGLPASRFGLRDRGRLKLGCRADVTIFDADAVADRATYEHPTRQAEGIVSVVVNGVVAWSNSKPAARRSGRFL
jgi:N-acyl-D-amino-acid deacylase